MKPFNEHGTKIVESIEIGEYILHGDVIIEKVMSLPVDFNTDNKEPKNALAYGEATGHIHQLQGEPGIDFDLRINIRGERHLRIIRPTMLKHQEHSPIKLPIGDYKIGIQREYDPFEKLTRSVVD